MRRGRYVEKIGNGFSLAARCGLYRLVGDAFCGEGGDPLAVNHPSQWCP